MSYNIPLKTKMKHAPKINESASKSLCQYLGKQVKQVK